MTAHRLFFALLLASMAQAQGPGPALIKPSFNNVIKLNAYVDNWCLIYINGKLAAVDSIEFLPHNVVSVNVLPSYPMTIAVLAKDNADPKTGMEYGTNIGDAGFALKLGDTIVSSSAWKAKAFFHGPVNRDTRNPKVTYTPIPANWFAADFDDSGWANATEYTQARIGADGDFASFDFAGAKFIWTDDLDLDNTVILRYTVPKPASFTKTWNADGDTDITNIIFEGNLAPALAPQLYQVSPAALATGYVTRVRGAQQSTEQLATTNNGVTSALSIDLGPEGDQVFLVLYGANLPVVTSSSASVGGVATTLAYAGALTPANGVAQFNIALPRSLVGAGMVPVVVSINGKSSNTVYVSVR